MCVGKALEIAIIDASFVVNIGNHKDGPSRGMLPKQTMNRYSHEEPLMVPTGYSEDLQTIGQDSKRHADERAIMGSG